MFYLLHQVSAYYNQLALVNAGNDKGPSEVEPYSIPDAFHYLQAQVGPVGPRGMAGMYVQKHAEKAIKTQNFYYLI